MKKLGQIDRREAACTFFTLVGGSSANLRRTCHREEDMLEGLCLSPGLGAPQDSLEVPGEAAGGSLCVSAQAMTPATRLWMEPLHVHQ